MVNEKRPLNTATMSSKISFFVTVPTRTLSMGNVRLFVIYLLVLFAFPEASEASSDEILALVRHRHELTGGYLFQLEASITAIVAPLLI